MSTPVLTGATEPIETLAIVDVNGNPLTGLTDIVASFRRVVAGVTQWLDFVDMTFRATPTTYEVALSQVDATRSAGIYRYLLDTSAITNVVVGDRIQVSIRQTPGTSAKNARQGGELLYGYRTEVQSGLATVTNVTDATTAINAHTDSAVSPLATTVQLTAARDHIEAYGDLHWTTASTAGLALSSDTDALAAALALIMGASFDTANDSLHALRARGDSTWITANISSLATTAQLDAHALAIKGATFNTLTDSLEAIRDRGDAAWTGSTAGDVATAVWATTEGGSVGTVRYAITLLRKRQTGRRKMGNDGYELIYDDDNVTVIKKTLVKDINGDIVVPGAGDPSEVSQEMDP